MMFYSLVSSMNSFVNTLIQSLPLPILIGIGIWLVSFGVFLVFFIILCFLFTRNSTKISQRLFLPNEQQTSKDVQLKSVMTCDSLSLISTEQTPKTFENERNSSFYLGNFKNEILPSLPLVKLRSLIPDENKGKNLSTRRSIIKDLNTLSNSFKDKNIHQSIDSIFSKDSLVQ